MLWGGVRGLPELFGGSRGALGVSGGSYLGHLCLHPAGFQCCHGLLGSRGAVKIHETITWGGVRGQGDPPEGPSGPLPPAPLPPNLCTCWLSCPGWLWWRQSSHSWGGGEKKRGVRIQWDPPAPPEGLWGGGFGGTEGPQPHSRLAELDQVLVCGAGVQPPDVEVGLAELIRGPPGWAGAGGAQGLCRGHIGLLGGGGGDRGSVPSTAPLQPPKILSSQKETAWMWGYPHGVLPILGGLREAPVATPAPPTPPRNAVPPPSGPLDPIISPPNPLSHPKTPSLPPGSPSSPPNPPCLPILLPRGSPLLFL